MSPVKVVPKPLPSTTKFAVLMLARSALVSVVSPADSMPNELVPVRGRSTTAALPPWMLPASRSNALALRTTFAMPPPLVMVPSFLRLFAVSVIAPFARIAVPAPTCRLPLAVTLICPAGTGVWLEAPMRAPAPSDSSVTFAADTVMVFDCVDGPLEPRLAPLTVPPCTSRSVPTLSVRLVGPSVVPPIPPMRAPFEPPPPAPP